MLLTARHAGIQHPDKKNIMNYFSDMVIIIAVNITAENKFFAIKKNYLLMCTTFAGGKPLKKVDDAWE
jgi:hypothetical protein